MIANGSSHYYNDQVSSIFAEEIATKAAKRPAQEESGVSRDIRTMLPPGPGSSALGPRIEYTPMAYRNVLVEYICAASVSINSVTTEAFKKLVWFLNPRAARDHPCGNTISGHIDKQYLALLAKVKTRVLSAPFRYSIVVDAWSSRQMIGFFGTSRLQQVYFWDI